MEAIEKDVKHIASCKVKWPYFGQLPNLGQLRNSHEGIS